jgi:hypothetical protein
MASQDMRERAYFEIWMDNIVFNPHKNRNINDVTGGLVRYYDEYAYGGKLNIYQVNDRGVQLVKYTCENIFPLALSPMTASWEENDTYQRFNVTLSYRYHTVDFFKKPLIPTNFVSVDPNFVGPVLPPGYPTITFQSQVILGGT